MIAIRPSGERGHSDLGWLDSRHTFSFSDYHDPDHMGFRDLRVINDDRIDGGRGFGRHPHRDMEIITYVLDGALEHADSLGTGSVIVPGDVQRMTAGTGVFHSEFNHSPSDSLRLLQIWILPRARGLKPGYEQKTFSEADKRGKLRLVAARDGRDGAVTVNQDVDLYATVLGSGERVRHELGNGRHAWVQVARGSVSLNGKPLKEGDGAAVTGERGIEIVGDAGAGGNGTAEVLVFDLP